MIKILSFVLKNWTLSPGQTSNNRFPLVQKLQLFFYYTYKWLLLGFTTLFNILGHQRRLRHRAWKARQILLRGSNFVLKFFYVPKSTTRDLLLYLSSEGSHTQDFLRSEKSIYPRPGSNPRNSDPEASMLTTGPPGSTLINGTLCITKEVDLYFST